MSDQATLFENKKYLASSASFSSCGKYRYQLLRVWDDKLPRVMFVGLNPSTANAKDDDPTIKSIVRIAKHNGYGGVYMMNCFPYVSTDPKQLINCETTLNDVWLESTGQNCKDVVFAWGNFKIVEEYGIDAKLTKMFPGAKALHINKNGSPKHPLYCKSDTVFVDWKFNNVKK